MPIFGAGDIASVLKPFDRPMVNWFASGVSNSACVDKGEFEREEQMLSGIKRGTHLIYFSSLCVYTSKTPYAIHKWEMERLAEKFQNFTTIVRLGNITWGKNPNTIINYFKRLHSEGETPEIKDVYRHLITIEEFNYWMSLVLSNGTREMNCPGEMVHVKEIWERVKKGVYGTI